MARRIIWGFVMGFGFLALLMQSPPYVLTCMGVVHGIAQFEYCSLMPGLSLRRLVLHIAISSAVWVCLSLALAGLASGKLAILALTIVVLGYAERMVLRYERRESNVWYLLLLRSLLFVTLPLSFIPAIAINSRDFPYLMLLIGASWAADSGAIFAGRLFGSTPLAPRISPKKTSEGLLGGLLAAGFTWSLCGVIWPVPARLLSILPGAEAWWITIPLLFVAGALLALAGLIGDLTFSLFKRQARIKDYSQALPGHGGVLDRFDSMLFVAPLIYALCCL